MSRREVNPARAGMIPGIRVGEACALGKPRASGDDPVISAVVAAGLV